MNKTLRLKVGALQKFLSINGYQTLNSFTKRKDGSKILDIKTLKRINHGDVIKVDHLETIGNELKKSVEVILSFNDNEYFDRFSQKIKINLDQIGNKYNLEGILVDFNELMKTAMICDDIYIKLEISSITENIENHLINFEKNLKNYQSSNFDYRAAPNIMEQIKEKKLHGEIKNSFNVLGTISGNKFFITSIEYWEKTRRDEGEISFDKKRKLIIAIVEPPIKNVNFEISKISSPLPPKSYLTEDTEESSNLLCKVFIEGKILYFNKKTELIINEDHYEHAVLVDKATDKVIYKREDDSFHL